MGKQYHWGLRLPSAFRSNAAFYQQLRPSGSFGTSRLWVFLFEVSLIPGGPPSPDDMMELMAQDKKVKHGKLTFILTRGIGRSFIATNVDPVEVRAFLAEKLQYP